MLICSFAFVFYRYSHATLASFVPRNEVPMISSYTLQTRIVNRIRLRFFDSLLCQNHAHLVRSYQSPKSQVSRWGKDKIVVSESDRSLSPFSQFDEDLSFVDPVAFQNPNKGAEPKETKTTTTQHKATVHKTVLLLHGFPELWWSWKHQFEPLTHAGYRVIAVDLRGFGGSECPENPTSYDVFRAANDLLHLLRSLDISSVTLVGHGLGAEIAHFLSLYAPSYVDALVSLNYTYTVPNVDYTMAHRQRLVGAMFDFVLSHAESAIEFDYEKRAETLLRRIFAQNGVSCDPPEVLSPYKHASNSIVDRLGEPLCLPHFFDETDLQYYLENYRKTGFAGPVNFIRNMNTNNQRFLSLKTQIIQQPTLVFTGDVDILTSTLVRQAKSAYREVKTHCIPDGGSFLQMQKSDEVNTRIMRFLQRFIDPDAL